MAITLTFISLSGKDEIFLALIPNFLMVLFSTNHSGITACIKSSHLTNSVIIEVALGPPKIFNASKIGVSLIAIRSSRQVQRACPLGPALVVK